MKSGKKLVIVICFFLAIIINTISAQIAASVLVEPVAYLGVNGEKSVGTNGVIDFSTSFFIKHIAMDENTKHRHIIYIMDKNKSFSKLELINITENKDVNDKGFMVVVNLKAADNDDLTSKIKFLLNELNVNKVNYNNSEYKLNDFKF